MQQDVDLTADDLAAARSRRSRGSTGRRRATTSRRTAREQLRRAVAAVFQSWQNPRAQVYRRTYAIPDDIGTAVNVVQMVFGNKGDRSATGVCFTRDPSTGENGLYGEYLVNAQGEDVVAGIRTPQPIEEMRERLPEAYDQLMRHDARGSSSTTATCRTSSSRSRRGRSTCCRRAPAKRTAAAALRAAADMTTEGLISREEAVARIDPAAARPAAASDDRSERRVRGRGARAERVAGRGVRRDRARRRHGGGARQGAATPVILVGWETTPGRHPRDDPGAGRAHRARRHDLARGGRRARDGQAVRRRLRRARDRRRQRRRCASAATSCARATRSRSTAARGRVIIGEVPLVPPQINEDFETILGWADDVRRLKVRANADNAEDAAKAREFGAAGHRPLPHRAHVLRRGAAPGRAGDDPRRRRGRPPRGARPAAAVPAGRLRGDLRGDGRPAGDDPPARPAAARVPAAARGRRPTSACGSASRLLARGEPDARDARLPARHPVARDLRDAGARDRARRAGGAGAHGRRAARRDHAPARRLRRGAAPAARAHRAR